jgi:hypothetical protein
MAVHNRVAAQLVKGGVPVVELQGRLTRFLGRSV